MKSKILTAFVFFLNIILVKSECGSYSECLREFFNTFYGKNEKFEPIDLNNNKTFQTFNSSDVQFESSDINDIVSGVSSFLQSELKGNESFEHTVIQDLDNNTKIFVKTFTIGDNDQLSELFSEYNIDRIDKEVMNNFTININNTEDVIKNRTETPISTKETKIVTETKDIHENEIPDTIDYYNTFEDYFGVDNITDYQVIDYLDLYKDTTNEYVDFNPTEAYNVNNEDAKTNDDSKTGNNDIDKKNTEHKANLAKSVFPWVAAIFVKQGDSEQFDYYCDGAILSDQAVITAARCVQSNNSTVETDDLIVLFGKTSLQSAGENERAVKVKEVIVHENFTLASAENDVAILIMGERLVFSDGIQRARFGNTTGFTGSYTTGWSVSGDLSVIQFVNDKPANCVSDSHEQTFCAVFGSDVTVCPSYGGVYVVERNESFYLRGIRTSDPTERELCTNDPVYYTSLEYLDKWISDLI